MPPLDDDDDDVVDRNADVKFERSEKVFTKLISKSKTQEK
jgi:hypothetical protein